MQIRSLAYGQRDYSSERKEQSVAAVNKREREQLLNHLAATAAARGFAIAFDLLHDRAEAEDAVQDALAKSCERWQQLKDQKALDAWFLRILVRQCFKVLRRRRLRRLLWGTPQQEDAPNGQSDGQSDGHSDGHSGEHSDDIDAEEELGRAGQRVGAACAEGDGRSTGVPSTSPGRPDIDPAQLLGAASLNAAGVTSAGQCSDAAATVAHRQEVRIMLRLVEELPSKQRVALLLRYGHELSIAEIAEILNIGSASVKTHLVRGMRRLRASMERPS